MQIKKIVHNQFSENPDLHRILLVLDDDQQVSLWIGENFQHEDVVEVLLSSANDLVQKSKRIHQTIPATGKV